MAIEDKVVITAALTGVAANRNQCQWTPYTPQESAEDALACYNAGASVVHIPGLRERAAGGEGGEDDARHREGAGDRGGGQEHSEGPRYMTRSMTEGEHGL